MDLQTQPNAVVDQLLHGLTHALHDLHALRPWRVQQELQPVSAAVVAACHKVQQLAAMACGDGAADAAAAALGRHLVASGGPARALHAVAALALAHASAASAAPAGPATPPHSPVTQSLLRLLHGHSAPHSVSSSISRSSSSSSCSEGSSEGPPTLEHLVSRATATALPPDLVPAARAVLAACVHLQQRPAWSKEEAAARQPADQQAPDLAPDAAPLPPPIPPTTVQPPPLHLLLQEQLRSPGARVAQLLCLAWALARLDPEEEEGLGFLDWFGCNDDDGDLAQVPESARRKARLRRRRARKVALDGSGLEGAKRRASELRQALEGLGPVLQALALSPLQDSADGAAAFLSLSSSTCHLNAVTVGNPDAAPSGIWDDEPVRALCRGADAASVGYQLLADVAVAYGEDVLCDCMAAMTGAEEATANTSKTLGMIPRHAGTGSALKLGRGTLRGLHTAVHSAAASFGARAAVYAEFLSGLDPAVAPALLSMLTQGLGPAAHALPDAPGGFGALLTVGAAGSTPAACSRGELLLQVMDVAHNFLTFLTRTVRPLTNHTDAEAERKIPGVMERPLACWPEATASTLLLMGRVGRWMQGEEERGEAVGAVLLGVGRPPTAETGRARRAGVLLFGEQPPAMQRTALLLLQHLLTWQQDPTAEMAAGAAGAAAAAAPAEAAAAAPAPVAAVQDASGEVRQRRRLWSLLPRLLEGLAASACMTRQIVELSLREMAGVPVNQAAQRFTDAASFVRKCTQLLGDATLKWQQQQRAPARVRCSCSAFSCGCSAATRPGQDSAVLAAASVQHLAAAAESLLVLQWHLPQDARAVELSRVAAALVLPPLSQLASVLVTGWAVVQEAAQGKKRDAAATTATSWVQQPRQQQGAGQASELQGGTCEVKGCESLVEAAAGMGAGGGWQRGEGRLENGEEGGARDAEVVLPGEQSGEAVVGTPWDRDTIGLIRANSVDGREAEGTGQTEGVEQGQGNVGGEQGGGKAGMAEEGGQAAGGRHAAAAQGQPREDWRSHGVLLACRKLTCVLALALCKARQEDEGGLLLPWEARLAVGCNVHKLLGDVLHAVEIHGEAMGMPEQELDPAAWADAWTAVQEEEEEEVEAAAGRAGQQRPGAAWGGARAAVQAEEEAAAAEGAAQQGASAAGRRLKGPSGLLVGGEAGTALTAAAAAQAESRACLTHVCILARKLLDLVPAPPPASASYAGDATLASTAAHADRCLVAGWWAADMLRWPLLDQLVALASSPVHSAGSAAAGGASSVHSRAATAAAGASSTGHRESWSECREDVTAHGETADDWPGGLAPVCLSHLVALFRGLRSRLVPLARAVVAGGAGLAQGMAAEEAEGLVKAAEEAVASETELRRGAELLGRALVRAGTGSRGQEGKLWPCEGGGQQGGSPGGSSRDADLGGCGSGQFRGCVDAPSSDLRELRAVQEAAGSRDLQAGCEAAAGEQASRGSSREEGPGAGAGVQAAAEGRAAEGPSAPGCSSVLAALRKLGCALAATMANAHESLDWALLLGQPTGLALAMAAGRTQAQPWWPAWLEPPVGTTSPQQAAPPAARGGSRIKAASQGALRKALPPGEADLVSLALAAVRMRCELGALLLQAAASSPLPKHVPRHSNGTTAGGSGGDGRTALRYDVCFHHACASTGAQPSVKEACERRFGHGARQGSIPRGETEWIPCQGCGFATFCCGECAVAAAKWGHHGAAECAVMRGLAEVMCLQTGV